MITNGLEMLVSAVLEYTLLLSPYLCFPSSLFFGRPPRLHWPEVLISWECIRTGQRCTALRNSSSSWSSRFKRPRRGEETHVGLDDGSYSYSYQRFCPISKALKACGYTRNVVRYSSIISFRVIFQTHSNSMYTVTIHNSFTITNAGWFRKLKRLTRMQNVIMI